MKKKYEEFWWRSPDLRNGYTDRDNIRYKKNPRVEKRIGDSLFLLCKAHLYGRDRNNGRRTAFRAITKTKWAKQFNWKKTSAKIQEERKGEKKTKIQMPGRERPRVRERNREKESERARERESSFVSGFYV